MPRKIVVTGGTGYIGSHTAVELINRGFNVIIADDLSNSDTGVLEGIEKITGIKPGFKKIDLCSKKDTASFFSGLDRIDAVVHFAAFKSVAESVEKPLDYYRNNLNSLINVIDQMVLQGIPNLVFSSSCTVYGQPDILPVTEKSPVKKALSPYGNTKRVCEEIIEDVSVSGESLKSVVLRYFNPIGNHPGALIGELPRGKPNNLVPVITRTAIGKYDELKVFGNDYGTPDGTCIRDYINVTDLARAHVAAIDRLVSGKNENCVEVYNVGTGKGISVLELLKAFEKAAKVSINYSFADRRPGDIEKIWADPSLANKKLNWKATTNLEETLASAWEWTLNCREKGIL